MLPRERKLVSLDVMVCLLDVTTAGGFYGFAIKTLTNKALAGL